MAKVFEIRNEFGRFFDERIYKQELAHRIPNLKLEYPITISHEAFSTTYYLDGLIGSGAFEFKTAQSLTSRHRGQLYNYLLMLDLAHGKLVNLRPESVEHEFVNATLRPADRHAFEVATDRWDRTLARAGYFMESLTGLLHDWGTGLDLRLYEAALTHFLGGETAVVRDMPVQSHGRNLGLQTMRLAEDDVAFRLTALETDLERFETHALKVLRHVELRAILWVNIGLRQVTFTTLRSK
ncbi:MAG: GxxExxY protein [Planctomycetaceae bacterium]|nr:GxxExxY protein [Planctomycetaceae bacterium]